MMNKTQIYGDGDNVFIFFKEGSNETLYTLRYPIVHEISVNIPNNMETIPTFQGKSLLIHTAPEPIDVEIDFKVVQELPNGEHGYQLESSDKGGLFPKMKMFDNVKVSQMFRIINEKIKKRQKQRS